MSKYVWICLNISKYVWICLNMSEYIWMCLNISLNLRYIQCYSDNWPSLLPPNALFYCIFDVFFSIWQKICALRAQIFSSRDIYTPFPARARARAKYVPFHLVLDPWFFSFSHTCRVSFFLSFFSLFFSKKNFTFWKIEK